MYTTNMIIMLETNAKLKKQILLQVILHQETIHLEEDQLQILHKEEEEEEDQLKEEEEEVDLILLEEEDLHLEEEDNKLVIF